MIFAVDFDGTLCENKWPKIGPAKESVLADLRQLRRNGHQIILWTCRKGKDLDKAVTWCRKHGLIFDAVNENLPEIVESFGGDCRKIFANYYLDDRNITPEGFNTCMDFVERV